MIRVGTSGFKYTDWVGSFYPKGLPEPEMFPFYAREFDACELNFSYYRMPDARTLDRMAAKVPESFMFVLKAFQGLTHERLDNPKVFQDFVAAVTPLYSRGQLGCVLLQFPFSFHATAENRSYLEYCRTHLADLPAVVEFRNARWITPNTFDLLRSLDLGYCCVDEPRIAGLLPPLAEATADVAYVRFHGRNAAKWWQHEHAWERYDYTYSEEELAEWVPKIRALTEKAEATYVFANNHWEGQAVATARQLKMMLGLV